MSLRVAFLGRNEAAILALQRTIEAGAEVCFVVAPLGEEGREYTPRRLGEWAADEGLRVGTLNDLEEFVAAHGPPDLLLSFLYWRKVPPSLLDSPGIGAFNFHPGPLPDFRGARGYNHAILEGVAEYGATVHWMTDRFDEGDLVSVRRFPVRSDDTALSLYQRTMRVLIQQCGEFVEHCLTGRPIPRNPQEGPGRSATRAELLEMMRVDPKDPPEMVRRKARAFWFPPFTGATVDIGGEEFTVVDRRTLERLGELLHDRLLTGSEEY